MHVKGLTSLGSIGRTRRSSAGRDVSLHRDADLRWRQRCASHEDMNDSSYVAGSLDSHKPAALQRRNLVDPLRVEAARDVLCSEDEITLIADTFQILANPTRIQIVCSLARCELCVGDLAAAVDASHSAVSHHLRQLRQMRLVRHRRHGKLTYYALDDEHVARLFELGLEHVRERLR